VLTGSDPRHERVGPDEFVSHTENKSSWRDCAPSTRPIRLRAMEERADDAAIVEALRRGDEATFARLVDELTPALTRLAVSHVPSRAVAEEVVQDTWLGVIRGIDRFEGRSSLRTWIFQILLNNARTRGVRERRTLPFSFFARRGEEGRDEPAVDPSRFQGRRGEQPGAWAQPPVAWQAPEEKLASAATRAVLLRAISELPPRQRDVITLRDIQGYSSQEVCNILDLTETNQRVLLHRARSKVRAALEAHFEAERAEGVAI
jgi:RNA polymerase sigma-70 factor (ECF subfamily)